MAIRGGGDLATGVAVRLHRAGFSVLVLEIQQPLAVRRLVALAEAIYAGRVVVEGIEGRRADSPDEVASLLQTGVIPVLVDRQAASASVLRPAAIVDGRMRKAPSELPLDAAPLILEAVEGYAVARVLRAPRSGVMQGLATIGSLVRQGDALLAIDRQQVDAPFDGALRGLLHDGVRVERGMKVGDLDPRREARFCREVSDKALAVGGAVLEAILSRPELRRRLAE